MDEFYKKCYSDAIFLFNTRPMSYNINIFAFLLSGLTLSNLLLYCTIFVQLPMQRKVYQKKYLFWLNTYE